MNFWFYFCWQICDWILKRGLLCLLVIHQIHNLHDLYTFITTSDNQCTIVTVWFHEIVFFLYIPARMWNVNKNVPSTSVLYFWGTFFFVINVLHDPLRGSYHIARKWNDCWMHLKSCRRQWPWPNFEIYTQSEITTGFRSSHVAR